MNTGKNRNRKMGELKSISAYPAQGHKQLTGDTKTTLKTIGDKADFEYLVVFKILSNVREQERKSLPC